MLVANAGVPANGLLEELSQEQIDRMLEVNLRAPIALARALMPSMIERGSGHMVFMSSLSGKAASPASSLYAATKFGLRGFALALREDLHQHGIGVSVVLPGFIRDAGMFADSGVKLPPGVGTRSSRGCRSGRYQGNDARTAPKSRSPRWPCESERRLRRLRPVSRPRSAAGWGRPGRDRVGRGPARQALRPPAAASARCFVAYSCTWARSPGTPARFPGPAWPSPSS